MKKLIALVLLIALGTGGYAWYARASGDAGSAATQPAMTATVTRGNIFQAVAATGKVTSNLDVEIKCQASGEIIELPFDVSDHVKEGDILAKLNPVDEDRAVNQAQVATDSAKAKLAQAERSLEVAKQDIIVAQLRADANLAAAKAKAEDARQKAKRRKELLEQNLTSQEDYDTAQATADQADADVKSAMAEQEDVKAQQLALTVKEQDVAVARAALETNKIALADAQQRRDYCTVKSRIDGVVSTLNVQKGVIVASGTGGFSGGTTLMTLSDLSHIYVLASVDESDIGEVKEDSPCLVTADAYPGKHFRGKVVRIATKGVNTSNVVTFEVKIEITGQDKSLLKPEMTTNVQIVSAQKENVLVVPALAMAKRGRGNSVVTVVTSDGRQEDRPVTPGISDGENYEVVEGVKEGDIVVVHKDDTSSKWNGGGRGGFMGMGGGGRRSGGGGGGGGRGG